MANNEMRSMASCALLLHIVILGISYLMMNRVVDNGFNGSRFNLLALFSSIYSSMETAIIVFSIAFILSAIVVGFVPILSEFADTRFSNLFARLMALLAATVVWGLAINVMGKRWSSM